MAVDIPKNTAVKKFPETKVPAKLMAGKSAAIFSSKIDGYRRINPTENTTKVISVTL